MSDWKEIANSILGTIKERGAAVLEENKPALAFLEDRAEALAKLAWEYKFEDDAAKKAAIMTELEIVKQTIENELSALALVGKAESIATFKDIVSTAISGLVKYLPVILSAI